MQHIARRLDVDASATSARIGRSEWPTCNYIMPNQWRSERPGAVPLPRPPAARLTRPPRAVRQYQPAPPAARLTWLQWAVRQYQLAAAVLVAVASVLAVTGVSSR